MLIKILLNYIFGYVRISLEGYYIERFINICKTRKIIIWNLKLEKNVKLLFNTGIKDIENVKEIANKTRMPN